MGSTCSCYRRISLAGCCRHHGSCCGMCSVVCPFGGKRDATASLHSTSASQSAGLLERTSTGSLFPATLHTESNMQLQDQLDSSGPETYGTSNLNEFGLQNHHQNRGSSGEPGMLVFEQYELKEGKKDVEDYLGPLKKTKGLENIDCVNFLAEDEDNCPICLEEYDLENPKIDTQCKHHFHLGCILEWMERSETCPVCDTDMVFNESP